jgi:hypothetical protein
VISEIKFSRSIKGRRRRIGVSKVSSAEGEDRKPEPGTSIPKPRQKRDVFAESHARRRKAAADQRSTESKILEAFFDYVGDKVNKGG